VHLQDLVAEFPAAKELFDKATDILGYDLLKVGDRCCYIVAGFGRRQPLPQQACQPTSLLNYP
jgi:hypothetical protein